MRLLPLALLTVLTSLCSGACDSKDETSTSSNGGGGATSAANTGGTSPYAVSTNTGGLGTSGTRGGTNAGGSSAGGGELGGTSSTGGGSSSTSGFTIQPPTTHQIACGEIGDISVADADWVCTFDYGGAKGYVYILATPTSCTLYPNFTTQLAQISINNTITKLENATYEWGGNHHNDKISFTYSGNEFYYYHS